METLPGPSNPNLVKFVDYFLNAEFYKEEKDVLKQFPEPDKAQQELERKRRVGELIAIIWAYYDDIKHLIVDGIKIIPHQVSSSHTSLSTSKTVKNTNKIKNFKECLPIKLCIQVIDESSTTSESKFNSDSPSPVRRRSSSQARSESNRRPDGNLLVPSVFVQINFGANYPSTSANVTVDVVQSFHLSKGKVTLLRQLARRYVESNSGKELIYGLIWEMKYYLTLLATLADDHLIFHCDKKQGVELLLQLGGPNYLTALANGLDEALVMKQQKMRHKPKQLKKLTMADEHSLSASKQSIRKLPIKVSDLISGKVLTEESGRKLMPKMKTFTFTPRTDPNSSSVTVTLHDPQSETFLYTLSSLQFVCQQTNYLAYSSVPQNRYRLTSIQFDLTHIANRAFVEFWPTIACHLEERLKLFFSKDAVNHYLDQTSNFSNTTIEQISKYEYFDVQFDGSPGAYAESKNEMTQITFVMVKEAYQENENESLEPKYTFKFSDLKKAFNLGSLRLSEDRTHMYTSRLLTTLDHLHKSQFFYGEFNPDKIYVAQDGSIKLFDPYLETLAMVFIPFVFENEIEVLKNALRVCEQPEFEEYFVNNMFSNDVFNFGSFVLSIVTDFQFEPIMLVANGFDLEKSKVSKMLMKKLTSHVNKASLIDFISLCINPNVYERTELNMLLHHSYVLEWNARVVKEIALQPQKDYHDTNVYEKSLLETSVNLQLNQENDTDLNFLAQISKYNRSEAEFKPLCLLGKGGFGSVIKVQNRLDEFYYALKRIAIEEDEIHKLRREVQHLSRLSHPNVTRYFAAWTETYNENWEYLFKSEKKSKSIDDKESDDREDEEIDDENDEEDDKEEVNEDSFVVFKKESSKHFERKEDGSENTDESDSDEYNDENEENSSTGSSTETEELSKQKKSYNTNNEESSFGLEIEFANSQRENENYSNDPVSEGSVDTLKKFLPKKKEKRVQSKVKTKNVPRYCLCIQMELCEMDTLQTQIAKKRFLNNPEYKVRVLSEILSALDYIHKMNIIHRDLKPQNILFDSKNRAKIGDFGLALAVTSKPSDSDGDRQEHNAAVQLEILNYKSNSRNSLAESHSVGIGTALYMAPEIYFDAHYTNLVDIFSLGVIIVEMCYPMETQSERARVLGSLKPQKTQDMSIATYSKMMSGFEPSFPADIGKYVTEKELKLLKSLLDVCPKNRPSADNLLKEGVFGVVAVDEKRSDDDLIELEMLSQKKKMQIQSIIDDSGSPHYHFMLRLLFSKNYSVFDTTLFDFNGVNESSENFYSSLFQFNLANRLIETLSRQFGALHLQSMPFLLPKGVLYQPVKETLDSCPLLNSDGFIVSLPANIRLQLARYLALSGNPAQFLTRSTMERVFYKQHLGPYHPKEFWTSSFDLIWPRAFSKETVIPYVEILSFSTQILSFFLPLLLKTSHQSCASSFDDYTLVFNLTNLSIFQAICNHLQINSNDYQTILTLLADNQENILKNSFHEFSLSAKMELAKNPESNASYELLFKILSAFENSPSDLKNHIFTQLCSSYKSQAVKHFMTTQIDPLITEMETMHRLWCSATAKLPILPEAIKFRFGLSIVSHTTFYYNHILLHATLEQQSRIVSVVAIGGRYDGMINGYESLYKKSEKDFAQKKSAEKEQNQYDSDFWPTWEKKPPDENNGENASANLSPNFAERFSVSNSRLEQKPFQPKHALGISFSIDKLSRFFSVSTETTLDVINNKFQAFFPFGQQPLGHLDSPNLIDLLIVPSSAGQNVCRLAQHFRSSGLRVIVMPELGPRENKATLSHFSEDEPRLEMVNRYACNLQIRLVLLIDHYANAAIRQATINNFVIREYIYGIGYDGQPITATNLRTAGTGYVPLDGAAVHQWKVHPVSTSESATIAYILFACGMDSGESSCNSSTWANTSEEKEQQGGGSPHLASIAPTGGSEEQMTADREPLSRTNRSASFSVKGANQPTGCGANLISSSSSGAGGGINFASFSSLSSSPNQYNPGTGAPFSSSTGSQQFAASSFASSSSSNFDIDFICANKSADRRRLSTSILSFVHSKLPFLSSNVGVRVLAIDVSYQVVKAIADIVDSDLLSDFVQNVHNASTFFESTSLSSSLSTAETNNVLENMKNYFFSRFKDLLTRNKRDSDIINKTISEMWDLILKHLKQNYGNKGTTPNIIFVLVSYKDGNLKYRLISF